MTTRPQLKETTAKAASQRSAAPIALVPGGAGAPPPVEAAGPGAAEIEPLTLAVENMYCGTCIRDVETALCGVPGVESARVNLTNRRVVAYVDTKRVSSEQLVEALQRTGFAAAEIAGVSAGGGQQRDQDLLRRLGVAGFAAMNIMLLSVSVWSGHGGDMDTSIQTLFHWLSGMIAIPTVAYSGQPFFRSAVAAIRGRRLNMDVPISLGVLLATGMSLYQTARASEQVYFDAAVTLLAFLLLGRLLDEQMRTRASSAAANLLGLKSSAASVIDAEGRVTRVPLKAVEPGMRVQAAAGERIPVDGIVSRGATEIDQALITGETLPRNVREGDTVFAGTVNLGQPVEITATKREESSLLSEIARLMSVAEQGRGKYVRLADRAARMYAPAVHVLGLTTFLGWLAFGASWQDALTAAIAVLIITCPCALALAVPAVQVAAASRLFSKGIILKAADGLERLSEIDAVVLDKTGTLTVGEPRLLNAGTVTRQTLAAAASLAAASRHPYSRALVAAAIAQDLDVASAKDVVETPGYGLSRRTGVGEERLGSARWCGREDEAAGEGELWFRPASGEPVVFRFADALREDSADVVARLSKAGLTVELLSGDAKGPVASMAEAAGIATWLSEQRPDEKIARLQALRQQGHKVLMVGDGLNDAPALATAHASLSPAAAADISQTVADAIFQGARLGPVLELIATARSAHRLALQNFALAVGYNILFVPLAMAGLVTPLIAAVAMSTSSILVTANAVRLRTQMMEL